MPEQTQTSSSQDIEILNKMLRREISAVDSYSRCVERTEDPDRKQAFESMRESHKQRRDQLANRVRVMGGTPATSAGGWGRFATLVQDTASKFGERAVLKTLREGEILGLRMYETPQVSQPTKRFLEANVLPEQRETQRTISTLLRASA